MTLAVVAVESLGRRGFGLVPRPGTRVDEQQVLVAVVVVVEERDARAHRFGKELLAERTVGMDKPDPGCRRDIHELDRRKSLGLDLGGTDRGHGLGDDGFLGARAAADGHNGHNRESDQAQEPGAAGRAMFTHSPLS